MLFGKPNRVVKRILIVEDEPLTAFDTENMIREAGYEVVATTDRYADAVEKLHPAHVDLVLSDVRLSGARTGVDLAAVARERRVPVLFVTGNPPPNAHELVLGTLLKPYNDRTLKAALKAVDDYLAGRKAKPPKGMDLFGEVADQ